MGNFFFDAAQGIVGYHCLLMKMEILSSAQGLKNNIMFNNKKWKMNKHILHISLSMIIS